MSEPADSEQTRREAWTQAIVGDRTEAIVATFLAAGADSPIFVWHPGHDALRTDQNHFLLDYWHAKRGNARTPPVAAIDPTEMRPALGYLMLVEPIEDGHDFRYRLYGSLLATVSGADLTGRRVSEHWASDYVVDFSLASYRAVYLRGEPLYTLRHPARAEYTRSWERLILPFADETGAITRFVVGNVPVDRAGDVVRPRF